MLILLSPAKSLDFTYSEAARPKTQPDLLNEAEGLAEIMRRKSARDLAGLMSISDKLAELNVERFASWTPLAEPPQTKAAVLAFDGDVYEGLEAQSLSDEDLAWSQDHLRILSGLYGVLRPLDALQAYRLEMGTRLVNPRGKDLYQYWGHRVTLQLNAQIEALAVRGEPEVVVNLASEEYFKVVRTRPETGSETNPGGPGLVGQLITPVFEDQQAETGKYRIVSFYAKRARGLMARSIVEERWTQPSDLRQFTREGYAYAPEVSSPDRPVFRREAAAGGTT